MTCKNVWQPNLGQKFQHKSEEFFEFGLGDVGLGLWSGMASAPFGGPVHRHAQAHTTSSSLTSNLQTVVATMGRLNKRKQQLKRLVKARQARHDKDEFGREEEEEVTVLMLTLMHLARTLFGRRKSLSLRTWKSLARMKRSMCRDGWRSSESSRRASEPARYVGNSERSKRQRR